METSTLMLKNKSSLSTATSKINMREIMIGPNQPKFQQKLAHVNCFCYHCINNTKPIDKIHYPRIKAKDQYLLEDNTAYTFLITKLTQYLGSVKVPQTFIADSSSLIYFNNSKDKIKQKPNLALSQIKKYFDVRRTQYTKILKNQSLKEQSLGQSTHRDEFNSSKLHLSTHGQARRTRKKSISGQGPKKQKEMKQIAIINYKNKYSQILTQSCLGKYLAKRKNDLFWQQIQTISLIPPYKQSSLHYHCYPYQRTLQNLEQMNKIQLKVASIIDEQENFTNISVSSSINPESDFHQQKQSQNQARLRKNNIRKQTLNLSDDKIAKQLIQTTSKQIIAYFQVKLHIRLLSCNFKYMIDYQNNLYLTCVQNFIAVNLKENQLKMVHDRLSSLQEIGNESLADFKFGLEQKQALQLRTVLSDLVADCLEKRKLQLPESIYKRPNNQNLVNIFKKIFPSFNQEEVLTNSNWKNQFKVYLANCRQKILKVISQDEGIRILKRFGIIFYRTWN